jgi:hypothetical protein
MRSSIGTFGRSVFWTILKARLASDQPRAAVPGEVFETPLDGNQQAVLKTHDVKQVDEQPQQPGEVTGEVKLAEFRHGMVAADGGQIAFVYVMEWWRLFSLNPRQHGSCGVPALLHGRGRQTGHQFAVLHDVGEIAGDQDLRMPRNGKIG